MLQRRQTEKTTRERHIKTLTATVFLCLLCAYALTSCGTHPVVEKPLAENPIKILPEAVEATDTMEGSDFSRFNHQGERHKALPCQFCHEQNAQSPKPRFAAHQTCAGCHAQQFKDNSHPICATCHTGANTAELKPFPAIQSFTTNFNHAQHVRQSDCATCHQTEGKSMTIPSRGAAHASCFQCHTPDKTVGERNLGSCTTCHEAGAPDRISVSTTDVGFNFSHAKHGALNCASCHNADGGTQITTAMHAGAANSCATCHNNQKAFGANDFSDCRKCHTEVAGARSFGIKFSHAAHTQKDCATCHKAGSGVNFIVPNGEAAHQTCFQCHSPNKGGASFTSGKCFTCHQVNGVNDIAPARPFIAGNFSHTKHGFFECSNCHTSAGGRMDVPSVTMHKPSKSSTSCATCHNNEAAFGEDFTNCKRCHTGGSFKFRK